MPAPKPTPEEKLFAVIQGAKHPPIRGGAQAVSLRTLLAWVGPLDLPRANQLLGVIIVLLGAACMGQLFLWPSVERLLQRAQAPGSFQMAPPLQGLRPTEEYLQTMAQQDPFRVGETPVADQAVSAPPPRDPRQVVAELKLVGIAWGDDPVAMIEQAGQTYVVRPGEPIGEATVKDVFPDHVILQVDGQEVELF